MQSGENLINRPVISFIDGRQVGSVKGFYLDQNLEFITGIRLGSEGLFRRKFTVVKREHVVIFGLDAVLIQNPDAVVESDQVAELESWLPRESLKGREVNTPGGTKIGTIGDIIFDRDGHILGFKLSRVFVAGPLAHSQTITRAVVINLGREDGIMTIDLARAEQQNLKETYQEKVTAQLKEWKAEIEKLKAEMDTIAAEARAEVQSHLEALQAKQDVARQKLQELRQASSETWEELKLGLDNALAVLRQELDQVKQRAGKSIGWAEGLASQRPKDSIGWAEGVTEEAPEGSEGWVEGMGQRKKDSEGWVEGYEKDL